MVEKNNEKFLAEFEEVMTECMTDLDEFFKTMDESQEQGKKDQTVRKGEAPDEEAKKLQKAHKIGDQFKDMLAGKDGQVDPKMMSQTLDFLFSGLLGVSPKQAKKKISDLSLFGKIKDIEVFIQGKAIDKKVSKNAKKLFALERKFVRQSLNERKDMTVKLVRYKYYLWLNKIRSILMKTFEDKNHLETNEIGAVTVYIFKLMHDELCKEFEQPKVPNFPFNIMNTEGINNEQKESKKENTKNEG